VHSRGTAGRKSAVLKGRGRGGAVQRRLLAGTGLKRTIACRYDSLRRWWKQQGKDVVLLSPITEC